MHTAKMKKMCKWSLTLFTQTVVVPIFVMSDRFCQAVCPILPGSLTDFEIGIFLSLCLILCNSCLILSQRFQMKLSKNLWTKKTEENSHWLQVCYLNSPGRTQVKNQACYLKQHSKLSVSCNCNSLQHQWWHSLGQIGNMPLSWMQLLERRTCLHQDS